MSTCEDGGFASGIPREIYDIIVETLVHALADITPASSGEKGRTMPEGYGERVQEALKRYTVSREAGSYFSTRLSRIIQAPPRLWADSGKRASRGPAKEIRAEQEIPGRVAKFCRPGIYRTVYRHVPSISSSDGLILIDQHAAHERILFDRLKMEAARPGEKMMSQRLLIPEVASLSPGEFAVIVESMKVLEAMGIEVAPFGEKYGNL